MTTTDINPPDEVARPEERPCRPTVVVMTKRPVPGRVKTRLLTQLLPEQAVRVHLAMQRCVLARVSAHMPGSHVLALDDAETNEPVSAPEGWRVISQGTGNLGERLDRVWRRIGSGAVVFFGTDSPDVPAAALRKIMPALGTHDAAIGPAADGGYWTLAAAHYLPALLMGIDWGSASVYHQTLAAASRSRLRWHTLPSWCDIDDPTDLAALRRRLTSADEPALVRLRCDLENILTGVKP